MLSIFKKEGGLFCVVALIVALYLAGAYVSHLRAVIHDQKEFIDAAPCGGRYEGQVE
jgi:hypothetical protein